MNPDFINEYPSFGFYHHIDAYKEPENIEDWKECPKCKLKPHVWIFDNGNYTACGCHNSRYDHFSIKTDETIMECINRTGGFAEYDSDALRKKWNEYCDAGS